jgi:hypothetical protein
VGKRRDKVAHFVAVHIFDLSQVELRQAGAETCGLQITHMPSMAGFVV